MAPHTSSENYIICCQNTFCAICFEYTHRKSSPRGMLYHSKTRHIPQFLSIYNVFEWYKSKRHAVPLENKTQSSILVDLQCFRVVQHASWTGFAMGVFKAYCIKYYVLAANYLLLTASARCQKLPHTSSEK